MIDYRKLSDGIDYYKGLGYQYVEVPWVVPHKVNLVTLPADRHPISINIPSGGTLVGSGEQSFLWMMMKGVLSPGRYCCVTPCFRDEHEHNDLTRPYFMKVELIDTVLDGYACLDNMIKDAQAFFNRYAESRITVFYGDKACNGSISYDLVTKSGIELGSYGIRTYEGFTWAFGTGVAEPRLSAAIQAEQRNNEQGY